MEVSFLTMMISTSRLWRRTCRELSKHWVLWDKAIEAWVSGQAVVCQQVASSSGVRMADFRSLLTSSCGRVLRLSLNWTSFHQRRRSSHCFEYLSTTSRYLCRVDQINSWPAAMAAHGQMRLRSGAIPQHPDSSSGLACQPTWQQLLLLVTRLQRLLPSLQRRASVRWVLPARAVCVRNFGTRSAGHLHGRWIGRRKMVKRKLPWQCLISRSGNGRLMTTVLANALQTG
mmetsp:Transcript_84344/g.149103  ORF Transcript_84344/g.149103 Transcript_84344/m.149103 type:complete len:229 (-) Transcript_84344:223-909(-)